MRFKESLQRKPLILKSQSYLLRGILEAVQSNGQLFTTASTGAEDILTLLSPLKALTVRQPWATAIRDLGKHFENRTWAPPDAALGQVIAIHAGHSFEEDGADWIAARLGVMLTSKTVPLGAIIALARLQRVVEESDDLWFTGPYGWAFADVLPLEPLPCKGKLSLWPVPVELRNRIRMQLDQRMSESLLRM